MNDKLSKKVLLERFKSWKREKHSTFYSQWKDKDEQAYQQIKEMIQKPEVTEEWIGEKIWDFLDNLPQDPYETKQYLKDFIRSLVEEIRK